MSMERIGHSAPTLKGMDLQAMADISQSGRLVRGAQSEAFAGELATRFGRRHVLLVNSGLSALHLSLLALGCGPGWTVHVPSYVCTALLNAITYTGAQPRLQDTPYADILLDPALPFVGGTARELVIYPQMFGVVAQLSAHAAPLIEDCAMAVGASACRQGRISTMSFYATKMLTTGQGGAILTDEDDLFHEIRDLMDYDNRVNYRVRFNADLTESAAILGRAQLRALDEFLARRRTLAEYYDARFAGSGLLPQGRGLQAQFPSCALFRYWLRVANLDSCLQALHELGIEAKSPVYQPLHRYLGLADEKFPHAVRAQAEILSIPFYPTLTEAAAARVADAVLKFARPAQQ